MCKVIPLKFKIASFFFFLFIHIGLTQTISYSPNTGEENTSFLVTVTGTGTNFNASTTCVQILASPTLSLTGISVTSSTLLTGDLSIPIGTTPGTYNGRVYEGPGCTGTEYTCTSCFTITAAPPSIISISPNDADQGESITGVTFTGINTNFTGNTTCVEILTTPAITLTNVNVNSTTELTADITVPNSTTAGSYSARIYEGVGCAGAEYTCTNCFTINEPEIVFSPNTGEENTSFSVTVTGNGTNFNASTTCVQILASPTLSLTGISVTSPTLLTGNLSIPIGTTPGTYDGKVYEGPGCTGTEYDCFNCFTITAAPPAIISISPNNADQGESITGVTFTGINTNFTAANTTCVEILTTPTISLTNVNVNSTTELTADITVPNSTTAGTYNARIYEGSGCGGAVYTCTNCFTINEPEIVFSPNTGEENTSFSVTVTGNGTNFNASTTCVQILASPTLSLTGISVTSPTLLTGNLSIPIGTTPGTYDGKVYEGPGCTGTEYDCFNCFTITAAPPSIISINPNDADQGETITGVTFTGINTNFVSNITTCVEILTTPTISLTSVNVNSTTELTADITVPNSTAAGTYDARIYEGPNCGGAIYTCTNCFTVNETELVFSPDMGTQGTSFGVTVTGNGTDFTASTTIVVSILASPTLLLTGISVSSATVLTGNLSIASSTLIGTYDANVIVGNNLVATEYNCYNCFTVESALPVELISFEGEAVDKEIALEWMTASEDNSSHFEIQRSKDGLNWISIGEEKAAGFSDTEQKYQFLDRQPFIGENYYRLLQVDIDGAQTFSRVILVEMEYQGLNVHLYPNPTNGDLNTFIFSDKPAALDMVVTDITGNIVHSIPRKQLDTGENLIQLNSNILSPGLYFLILNSNGEQQVIQFVKI